MIVVYVDASYHDGLAGLAMTGDLGTRTEVVRTHSSQRAEVLAIQMAIDHARMSGVDLVVVRSDCRAAVAQFSQSSPYVIQLIGRAWIREAHRLARSTRKGASRYSRAHRID